MAILLVLIVHTDFMLLVGVGYGEHDSNLYMEQTTHIFAMNLIIKLLSKFHVSELAYKIEKRISIRLGTYSIGNSGKALEYLHGIYPDNGQSCVVKRLLPTADCDLEIIVPCYNSEKYVEKCIDSILSQKTKYNYCVTIINDGSKDRTRQILQKFERFKNINIIDQKNRGHSGARNTGIAQAHGKYLLFVDSDDMLLPGAVEMLMNLAEQTTADVVDSGHIRFADRTQKGILTKAMAYVYDIIQHPQSLPLDLHSPRISGYPCGKVLKTELFHKVQFPENYWFEDTLMWMIIEPMCRRKVTSNQLTFRYRMNPNSISHTHTINHKSIDSLYVTLRLLKDREELGIEFDKDQYDMLLQQMRNNFYRVSCLDDKIKEAVFIVESDLISNKFAKWSTTNPRVKPIEDFLRVGDYDAFRLWCKWH